MVAVIAIIIITILASAGVLMIPPVNQAVSNAISGITESADTTSPIQTEESVEEPEFTGIFTWVRGGIEALGGTIEDGLDEEAKPLARAGTETALSGTDFVGNSHHTFEIGLLLIGEQFGVTLPQVIVLGVTIAFVILMGVGIIRHWGKHILRFGIIVAALIVVFFFIGSAPEI